VIAGAQAGSIAQLDLSGVITPIVAVGTVLPDGKSFPGSLPYMVRTTTDGSVVFSSNYASTDSSLYTWKQGTIRVTIPAPFTTPDGNKQGWPKNMEVNRQGDVAFQLTWGAGGPFLFRIRNGSMAVAPATPVDGVVIGGVTIRSIDESGNVLFTGTNPDGTGFYAAIWDGSTTHLILSLGLKLPDGRSLLSVGNWAGCGDGLVVTANNLGVYARYRSGAWDYLATPSTPLATGAPANQLSPYGFDANRNCDVVFQNGGGNTDIGAFAGGQFRAIQDLGRLTPDGDLLIVSQLLINDDGTIYVLGANDQGQQVLYRATPLQ
jgi:hypothetical protein